ncbi:uncharacterized protein LOC143915379 [Arctopsyche grandis]|uniref:uncharacterized protein LOC143915379 n=1 Tax=Arctopsyche grandis TaxID=121162 RepID=UPI00406D77AB
MLQTIFKKMPQYNENQLKKALQEVQIDGASLRATARKYNIPRATLQFKLKKPTARSRPGPEPFLTTELEDSLVKWHEDMVRKGFPRKKEDIIDSVQKYLIDKPLETPFKNNRPGRGWLRIFLKRHPNLTEARTSLGITENDIRRWYRDVMEYLRENSFQDTLLDPTRIFNADETVFPTCSDTGRVFAPTGYRNAYANENITVLFTFSADGNVCPPLLVYPSKSISEAIPNSVPDDWWFAQSETGSVTSDVFNEFITNIFSPYLTERNIKRPVILFIDGHKNNITYQLSVLCNDLEIILVALYPNPMRILIQPADLSVFNVAEKIWSDALKEFQDENAGIVVTKVSLAAVLKMFLDSAALDSFVHAFQASGLYPFDANAVDYSECIIRIGSPELTLARDHMSFDDFSRIVGQEKLQKLETLDMALACSDDLVLYNLWKFFNPTNSKNYLTENQTQVGVTLQCQQEEINLKNEIKCRLCLSSVPALSSVSIYDSPHSLQQIWRCCQLQMKQDDSLPGAICLSCDCKLEFFTNFKNVCIQSDKNRRKKLSTDIKTEEVLLDDLIWEDNMICSRNSAANDSQSSNLEPKRIAAYEIIDSCCSEKTKYPNIGPSACNKNDIGENLVVDGDNIQSCYAEKNMQIIEISPKEHSTENRKFEIVNNFEIKCEYCQEKFFDRSEFRLHILMHYEEKSKKKHNCKICLKVFKNNLSLIHHMKLHPEKIQHKCNICLRNFSHKHILLKHKKIHMEGKIYTCDLCLKSFASKIFLVKHMRIHTAEKKCKICHKSFTKLYNLKIHMEIHARDKSHDCKVCLKSFTSKLRFVKHMNAHSENKPHNCLICKKTFSLESELVKHTITCGKLFKCDICLKGFRFKQVLVKHMISHTGEKQYKCDICSKSFSYTSSLNAHMASHTFDKPFKCDDCSKFFKSKPNLVNHIRTHTNLHKCSMCSKSFTAKSTLDQHMNTHTGKQPYSCDLCPKSFIYKSSLLLHRRLHTGENLHKCTICAKSFTVRSKLILHMNIVHAGIKSHECNVCFKFFQFKAHLLVHMRIHSGDKPYKCAICSKSFRYKDILTDHMDSHKDESYECGVCSKHFTSNRSLKIHSKIHLMKPHKCEMCSKSFIYKNKLARHISTHNKLKLLVCDICPESFSSKSKMVTHLKKHAVRESFECDVCSKSFACKINLQTHMKIH